MDLLSISKYFIFAGLIFLSIGGLIFFLSKTGIAVGKLPGDILIQKGNVTFYFPVISSILISVLLTVLINLFGKK